MVSEKAIEREMRSILETGDLNKLTLKLVLEQLSERFGADMKVKRNFIRVTLDALLLEKGDDDSDSGSGSDDDDMPKKKKKTAAKKTNKKEKEKKVKKPRPPPPEYEVSDELATFCNTKVISRQQTVKKLWAYVKANDLQDNEAKQYIVCDATLMRLFRIGEDEKRMRGLSMTKYLKHHFPEAKVKKESSGGGGLKTLQRLSPILADITGRTYLARTAVTKHLWKYIKSHELQNPDNKKEIICDSKFAQIMDGLDRVTMFQMSKFIGAHLFKIPEEEMGKATQVALDETDEDDAPEGAGGGDDDSDDDDDNE